MLEALGTYWDCGRPCWDHARRPVAQASVVLGALGPHCWFLPRVTILLWCFPILTVFLSTSCPFLPHFCHFPLFFHSLYPIFAVISFTIAPSRGQTSAFQYGPVPPNMAKCPFQDSECDPGLLGDFSVAQSPIPEYPTHSQCLSTPPVSPVAPEPC